MNFFSYADTSKKYLITDIIISGNEITEPEIIYNELQIIIGESVSEEDLIFNENRIMSLGLFTSVDLIPRPSGESYILEILLKEAWYIYPLPILDRRDKDWSKLSYGLQLKIMNFRGRNETLEIAGALGYDPYVKFNYKIPNLVDGKGLQMFMQFEYSRSENKSILSKSENGNFNQHILLGKLISGKRFDLYNYLYLSLGYNYIKIPFYQYGRTISTTGTDSWASVSGMYLHDERDLISYPSKGIYSLIDVTKHGTGESFVDYWTVYTDIRYYVEFWKLILSARNHYRSAFGGEVPYYADSYIGYAERIRGRYFEVFQGNNTLIANAEIKFPIVKDMPLEFDFPIIPSKLQKYKVLVDFHIFGDAGIIWNNNQNIRNNPLIKGFGFGITIGALPYSTGRIEIGFDEKLKSQLLIDIGAAF